MSSCSPWGGGHVLERWRQGGPSTFAGGRFRHRVSRSTCPFCGAYRRASRPVKRGRLCFFRLLCLWGGGHHFLERWRLAPKGPLWVCRGPVLAPRHPLSPPLLRGLSASSSASLIRALVFLLLQICAVLCYNTLDDSYRDIRCSRISRRYLALSCSICCICCSSVSRSSALSDKRHRPSSPAPPAWPTVCCRQRPGWPSQREPTSERGRRG